MKPRLDRLKLRSGLTAQQALDKLTDSCLLDFLNLAAGTAAEVGWSNMHSLHDVIQITDDDDELADARNYLDDFEESTHEAVIE